MQSTKPPTTQKYQKLHPYQRFDQRGGGVVIPCVFELNIKVEKNKMVVDILNNFFDTYEGTEKIELDHEVASCPAVESDKLLHSEHVLRLV